MDEDYCNEQKRILKELALDILYLYKESQSGLIDVIYEYPIHEKAEKALKIEIAEIKQKIKQI